MPSPQMQRVIDALWQRRAGRANGPTPTLAESRESFAPAGQLRALPADVVAERIDAAGVRAWWLTAPDARSDEILMYLHGGGYTLGSLRSHGPLAAHLGRATGRRVFFVEYRLAPEDPFPAAVEDTLAAWCWLTSTRVDPAAVIVAGDSAGGGLALGLIHARRDAGQPLPSAAVLISPFLDLTASGRSMVENADRDPTFSPDMVRGLGPPYLNGADPRDLRASPLFASHADLPPLLIQVGSTEVLLSDAERLAASVGDAGVRVTLQVADGLPHVYHGAIDAPETKDSIRRIAEFAAQWSRAGW